MGTFDQQEFDIRFEWGLKGVEALAQGSDIVIIIDVLSFSTCVEIVTNLGSAVYPYLYKDESAKAYAAKVGAVLAGRRGVESGYTLSPSSLLAIPSGTKLVLPSPNGSTLSLHTGSTKTVCGCVRNAKAVANYAMQAGNKIALIAAGEQWPDGNLRPAFEDLIGAGAIISFLKCSLSPESKAALSAFKDCGDVYEQIKRCSSGKELIERGFEDDVRLAGELNVSNTISVLKDGAYVSV